jgi:hypothetical protein
LSSSGHWLVSRLGVTFSGWIWKSPFFCSSWPHQRHAHQTSKRLGPIPQLRSWSYPSFLHTCKRAFGALQAFGSGSSHVKIGKNACGRRKIAARCEERPATRPRRATGQSGSPICTLETAIRSSLLIESELSLCSSREPPLRVNEFFAGPWCSALGEKRWNLLISTSPLWGETQSLHASRCYIDVSAGRYAAKLTTKCGLPLTWQWATELQLSVKHSPERFHRKW